MLLPIPGSNSWVWSQCQCQRLKTAGLASPSSNHKLSSSLKQADGNGVRLWKNRVDRIQDPVKGLTLTRRILASGLLLPLHPILSLPPSLPFSLFSSLYHTLSPLTFWARAVAKLRGSLFIYQLIMIPPCTPVPQRIFRRKRYLKQPLSGVSFVPKFLGIV